MAPALFRVEQRDTEEVMILFFPVLPTFLCYCTSESPRKPSHGPQDFVKYITQLLN